MSNTNNSSLSQTRKPPTGIYSDGGPSGCSLDVLSLDVLSLDVRSLDVLSLDVLSLDLRCPPPRYLLRNLLRRGDDPRSPIGRGRSSSESELRSRPVA